MDEEYVPEMKPPLNQFIDYGETRWNGRDTKLWKIFRHNSSKYGNTNWVYYFCIPVTQLRNYGTQANPEWLIRRKNGYDVTHGKPLYLAIPNQKKYKISSPDLNGPHSQIATIKDTFIKNNESDVLHRITDDLWGDIINIDQKYNISY